MFGASALSEAVNGASEAAKSLFLLFKCGDSAAASDGLIVDLDVGFYLFGILLSCTLRSGYGNVAPAPLRVTVGL